MSAKQLITPSFRDYGIRQLGFAHLPFPGATHTRFGHSIGVCHLAGIAFDSIFSDRPFRTRQRYIELRYCVRLAALLHDVGHGPFSHAAEFAMPACSELLLPADMSENRRASHEDYTVSILLSSGLSELIEAEFGFTAFHVAALIDPGIAVEDDFFWEQGIDLRCICSQLVSSNLDMDRLDYLCPRPLRWCEIRSNRCCLVDESFVVTLMLMAA